jgi:hypothetical protein
MLMLRWGRRDATSRGGYDGPRWVDGVLRDPARASSRVESGLCANSVEDGHVSAIANIPRLFSTCCLAGASRASIARVGRVVGRVASYRIACRAANAPASLGRGEIAGYVVGVEVGGWMVGRRL